MARAWNRRRYTPGHPSRSLMKRSEATAPKFLSESVSGPDFSLLTACYRYLARRLLTDDNPRAQRALRAEMLYDGSGASRIDLERLI